MGKVTRTKQKWYPMRYRQTRPEVARAALCATHGGLSWERCALLYALAAMAL
jgi:hypothetical protein